MGNIRNVIIVVVIAVVVLGCICPVVSYGLYWLWQNGDSLVGNTAYILPAVILL